LNTRLARSQDATALADLARALGQSLRPADLEQDLAAYPDGYYLTEIEGHVAGYLVLRDSPAPACVAAPKPLQLWKLYVHPRQHGRGVARHLMGQALLHAQRRGNDSLWLGMAPTNARAFAFYVKCGFRTVGTAPLHEDEPPDLILACNLG